MHQRMYDAFGPVIAVNGDDAARPDSVCFSDEVVVDFPSVAPAVDRIRQAFLAEERGEPLPTAVKISPREASRGALVPLDVPVRATCRACGGRGESWTGPCTSCDGSGTELHTHQLRVSVPAGVVNGSRFRFTVSPRHNPPTHIELRILVA
jgi:DnaJ-class molecular chaperone